MFDSESFPEKNNNKKQLHVKSSHDLKSTLHHISSGNKFYLQCHMPPSAPACLSPWIQETLFHQYWPPEGCHIWVRATKLHQCSVDRMWRAFSSVDTSDHCAGVATAYSLSLSLTAGLRGISVNELLNISPPSV